MGRCTHTPVLRSLPPAELSDGGYDTKNHLRNARMMDESIFPNKWSDQFFGIVHKVALSMWGLSPHPSL